MAFVLMGAQITGAVRTGRKLGYQTPDRGQATHSEYMTKDGMLMLGASNHRQHSRFWELVGQPERANKSYNGPVCILTRINIKYRYTFN